MDNRPKVLVSAYACEPHKGSEPGVGWNWAKQISKFAEVWVITRANNRRVIEEALKDHPEPNLHFIYVDLPKWMRIWKKGQRGVHLYYYLWQIFVFLKARKLHKNIGFDLVHHLTFGVYSCPSFISLLPVPFVWGPIGGVDEVPKSLRGILGIRGILYELFRDINHKARFNFDPFVRNTLKRSKVVLCRTKQTCKYISKLCNPEKVKIMSETGFSSIEALNKEITEPDSCVKIFSAGRLIALKGFFLTVKAFAKFHNNYENSLLEIAGAGYDMNRLKRMVKKEGIIQCTKFLNHINRKEVITHLESCSTLIYPSLREGGAWIIMEAMAVGRPIVCLDYSGIGEMVTDECGIKVEPITCEQTIDDLADALRVLAINPELRGKMGKAGRMRVAAHFTWEKKGEFIKNIYASILNW